MRGGHLGHDARVLGGKGAHRLDGGLLGVLGPEGGLRRREGRVAQAEGRGGGAVSGAARAWMARVAVLSEASVPERTEVSQLELFAFFAVCSSHTCAAHKGPPRVGRGGRRAGHGRSAGLGREPLCTGSLAAAPPHTHLGLEKHLQVRASRKLVMRSHAPEEEL